MKELAIRAASGAVYVALTLGAAWAGPLTTFLLFLPVCLIAASEMDRLIRSEDDDHHRGWNLLLVFLTYTAIGSGRFFADWSLVLSVGSVFMLVLIWITFALVTGGSDPARALGRMFIQIFIVAIPFGVIPYLFVQGPWLFIGFMLLLWTNDTGAYLVGRAIGRTKLLPAVSPKKTWEGLFGGIALTLLVSFLLSRQLDELPLIDWMACGVILALTATLGDLLESGLKRSKGVKDSGKVMPGHGGILDRFDGFLLAIPAMFLYLQLRS